VLSFTDPARYLRKLVAAAATVSTPIEAGIWSGALRTEIDVVLAKGARLRITATERPSRRSVMAVRRFIATVGPEIGRAEEIANVFALMYYVGPPSGAVH
jgi:hypothetical protein